MYGNDVQWCRLASAHSTKIFKRSRSRGGGYQWLGYNPHLDILSALETFVSGRLRQYLLDEGAAEQDEFEHVEVNDYPGRNAYFRYTPYSDAGAIREARWHGTQRNEKAVKALGPTPAGRHVFESGEHGRGWILVRGDLACRLESSEFVGVEFRTLSCSTGPFPDCVNLPRHSIASDGGIRFSFTPLRCRTGAQFTLNVQEGNVADESLGPEILSLLTRLEEYDHLAASLLSSHAFKVVDVPDDGAAECSLASWLRTNRETSPVILERMRFLLESGSIFLLANRLDDDLLLVEHLLFALLRGSRVDDVLNWFERMFRQLDRGDRAAHGIVLASQLWRVLLVVIPAAARRSPSLAARMVHDLWVRQQAYGVAALLWLNACIDSGLRTRVFSEVKRWCAQIEDRDPVLSVSMRVVDTKGAIGSMLRRFVGKDLKTTFDQAERIVDSLQDRTFLTAMHEDV